MSQQPKTDYSIIAPIAYAVRERLAPYCKPDGCVIAGSIRRRRAQCGDIEIVALPRIEECEPAQMSLLSNDQPVNRNALLQGTEYTVDLTIAEDFNFGWWLLIRTGSAAFNKWLVAHPDKGGILPPNMQFVGGRLLIDNDRHDLPTEETVFDLMGLPYIPATNRDAGQWLKFLPVSNEPTETRHPFTMR